MAAADEEGEEDMRAADALSAEAHLAFWSGIDVEERTQVGRILDEWTGDIEPDFLGFLGPYYLLARIVPRSRVIYDVGCAYGFQAWFFRHHRAYVGISDSPETQWRFHTANTQHIHARLGEWAGAVDPDHFAVHSYCPSERDLFHRKFRDSFTFYPGRTLFPVRS